MDGNGSFNTNIVNFDVKGRSDGQDERRLRQLVQEHPSAGAALLQPARFSGRPLRDHGNGTTALKQPLSSCNQH
eukprot:12630421-Alexandrium_andersonii.AAC.1